jgi:hypothetical protein
MIREDLGEDDRKKLEGRFPGWLALFEGAFALADETASLTGVFGQGLPRGHRTQIL